MNTQLSCKPEQILVEDDLEIVREMFAAMLTSAGYGCSVAKTPMEVWNLLHSGKEFDLICSGITEWPDEFFNRVVTTFPDVPVVVSTGEDDVDLMLKTLHMGAYDFLRRPFGAEQLIFAVRRALRHRRLTLENRALRTRVEEQENQLRETISHVVER